MSLATVGNTLLVGGGASLIYVRSRRSIVTLCVVGMVCAGIFGALAIVAFGLSGEAGAGVAFAAGAGGGLMLAAGAGLKLRNWPPARLGFFRDRLLVIQGRHEMRAVWTTMEAVTLSEPNSWPRVRLTDRLTIQFKNEPPLSFKPASFGLAPAACRDLILRLRDDAKLRARLPEFDSLRDLVISPVVAGELIEPRL
ncbi:MAG TPA: hypothetical protein VLK30_00590 [Candidatus Limnocylindrales bacterium]|nr:hypothetical protein [Candidatus Limnocylindrales bacterium]